MRWWSRSGRERDLDEEVRSHLAMAARDHESRGVSAEEAVAAAHREFGNVGLVMEATREVWRGRFLASLARDLRYAARALARAPGFAAVAILSLGLALGATTVAFTVIDQLLLRKLPVAKPERLVYLRELGWSTQPNDGLAYATYTTLRDNSKVLSSLAAEAMIDRSAVTISGPGGGLDPGRVRVAVISGNYFTTMGVGAQRGRTLSPDDDGALLGHPVAVISDGYWARRLNRAGDVVGRTLAFNGTTYTIIGVTQRGFSGDWVGRPADIFVPIAMHQAVFVEIGAPMTTRSNVQWLHLIGRLAPGVSREQSRLEIQTLYQRAMLDQEGPSLSAEALRQLAQRRLYPITGAHGYSDRREELGEPIGIMAAVVALVLLVACMNVAGLLLARAAARERELAVRLAIGAGRGRLTRQLLTESVLLASLGGFLGIVLAVWGTRLLAATLTAGPVRVFFAQTSWIAFDLSVNWAALAFTAVVCLAAGVLFGLMPALWAGRLAPGPALVGRGPADAQRGHGGPGGALVVAQVALSLAALITATLFLRTLHNLRRQDLGFDGQGVLLAWAQPSATARTPAAMYQLWHKVATRLPQLPGVVAAGASNAGVLSGRMPVTTQVQTPVLIDGEPPRPVTASVGRVFVTPDYFGAVGIPLVSGRAFTELDNDSSPQVAIVSRSMARFYFGGRDPVGRRVHFGAGDTAGTTIVGVVGDVVNGTPRAAGIPQMRWYLPYRNQAAPANLVMMMIAVRTRGDPRALETLVRRELSAIDANLPVLRVNTVSDQLDDVLAQDRLVAGLATFFGTLALLLACLGLYGLIAFTTARRTAEVGVRMALGATRRSVVQLVVEGSVKLALIGVLLGVPLSLAAGRLVGSRLFGVGARDPATIAASAVGLLLLAALAALLPAMRAASINPMVALRSE